MTYRLAAVVELWNDVDNLNVTQKKINQPKGSAFKVRNGLRSSSYYGIPRFSSLPYSPIPSHHASALYPVVRSCLLSDLYETW